MGACCSTGERPHGFFMAEEGQKGKENRAEKGSDHHIQSAENSGVRVRFEGSSRFTSMFSQQGRKGINQDAMTVWEVLPTENCSLGDMFSLKDGFFFLDYVFFQISDGVFRLENDNAKI